MDKLWMDLGWNRHRVDFTTRMHAHEWSHRTERWLQGAEDDAIWRHDLSIPRKTSQPKCSQTSISPSWLPLDSHWALLISRLSSLFIHCFCTHLKGKKWGYAAYRQLCSWLWFQLTFVGELNGPTKSSNWMVAHRWVMNVYYSLCSITLPDPTWVIPHT